MLTIDELIEKMLHEYEADDIISLLSISTDELLNRFGDRVEECQDKLRQELDDGEDSRILGGGQEFPED